MFNRRLVLRSICIAAGVGTLMVASPAHASSFTFTVGSHSNIFEADPSFPYDASANPPLTLDLGGPAPAGSTLTFNYISGTTNPGCGPTVGPDGAPTIIGCSLPLEGVFLPSAAFDFATPASSLTDSFVSVSPAAGQLFFIGDGVDNFGPSQTGQSQIFHVPTGATQLALGFVDAPGWFGDNGGSVTLEATLRTPTRQPAPEPATVGLLGAGLLGLVRRRFRRGR